jgi:hypothetical protein
MKRLFLFRCIALFYATIFSGLILFTGCSEIANLAGTANEATKGKIIQLESDFRQKHKLPIAKNAYAEAERKYKHVLATAEGFRIDGKVGNRSIQDLEREKQRSQDAFKKLQDAMKRENLPKFSEATDADLNKKIAVGSQTYTGEECYTMLKTYKQEIESFNQQIKRKSGYADRNNEDASLLETYKATMKRKLDEMKENIEDYEHYQKLFDAGKSVESFGLTTDAVTRFTEIDELIKRGAYEVQERAKNILNNRSEPVKDELLKPDIKITDNDLVD